MLGYCATGSLARATSPRMMVRTAMTLARTGRSMKNLAIMVCPCAQQAPAWLRPQGGRRWRDVDRLDDAARNGALDAADDDAIPRLQSALDDPLPAVDRVPGFDGVLLDDILLVDQEQVAPLLAVAERAIGHEQGFDV